MHPVLQKGSKFAIITAEDPRHPSIEGGNEALRQELLAHGYEIEPTEGKYDPPDKTEHGFLVHNPDFAHIQQLGHKFGQDSVTLHSNGVNHMSFTHGDKQGRAVAGAGHQVFSTPPEMYYTKIHHQGKPVYFSLNLDFDAPHVEPLEKSSITIKQRIKNVKSPSKFVSLKFLNEIHDDYLRSASGQEYDPEEVNKLIGQKHQGLEAKFAKEQKTQDIPETDQWNEVPEDDFWFDLPHTSQVVGRETDPTYHYAQDGYNIARVQNSPTKKYFFRANSPLQKSDHDGKYLVHFGVVPGLKELDPDAMGSSSVKSTENRYGVPEVHRTYFYRQNTIPEEIVASQAKSKYYINEPHPDRLYDLAKDKDSHLEQSQQELASGTGVGSLSDRALSKIREAGYHGFFNSGSSLPNVVGMFHKVPVVHEELAPPNFFEGDGKRWFTTEPPIELKAKPDPVK